MAKSNIGSLALILIVLILNACGIEFNETTAPYQESFNTEASLRGLELDAFDVEFIFVDDFDKPEVVGRCYSDGTVRIKRKFWDRVSSTLRENLVFHELGHCILHKGHVDNPNAIMYYQLLDPAYYDVHRDILIDQLFAR